MDWRLIVGERFGAGKEKRHVPHGLQKKARPAPRDISRQKSAGVREPGRPRPAEFVFRVPRDALPCHPFPVKRLPSAFTLIELLVVIVIVAVLASLVLPVYGRVQESARTVKCTSNLKQIGAALLSFAGDHNGLCPISGAAIDYNSTDATTKQYGWTQQLEPYAGTDKSLYVCPSSSRLLPNNKRYGYFQGCHAAYVAADRQFAALRLSLVSAPTKYILAGDISSNTVFADHALTDTDKDDYSQNPAFATTPCPFHGGKANLVFADGHCGGFAAFDAHAMTFHYDLKPDGTGYGFND